MGKKAQKRPMPSPPNPNGCNRGKRIDAPASYPAEAEELEKKATRCPHGSCTRILFKGKLAPGTDFEIQCPACGGYLHMTIAEAEV